MYTQETQTEFDFVAEPTQSLFSFGSITASPEYLLTLRPSYNVQFYKENQPIGYLDWSDGIMKFSGSVDDSAKVFFDAVIKQYGNWPRSPAATSWGSL